MAIVKIKLTKKINNVVNDYYPKTSADNVVYDSATTSLSNGTRLTFSNAENAAFGFTVYRVIGYK